MDTLDRDDRGIFEVRTLNTVYLIELVSDTEAWATRFPRLGGGPGELRKDGDRLPLIWVRAAVGGSMTMLLDGVADSGAQTLRGPTSMVTDILPEADREHQA